MKLSPTEQRIFDVLRDGRDHRREELLLCIDDMASLANLQDHISNMREKLRPHGLKIVCDHLYRYHLLRALASATDGTR